MSEDISFKCDYCKNYRKIKDRFGNHCYHGLELKKYCPKLQSMEYNEIVCPLCGEPVHVPFDMNIYELQEKIKVACECGFKDEIIVFCSITHWFNQSSPRGKEI